MANSVPQASPSPGGRSSPLGISVFMALCTMLVLGVMAWQVALWGTQAQGQSAHLQARMLAHSVAQIDTSTEEGEALLQQHFQSLQQLMPQLKSAGALEGVRFSAHTRSELAGTRLQRDDLEHKALYDDGKIIAGNIDRNKEEHARDSKLKRNPFETAMVRPVDGGWYAAAPVMVAGEMKGLVAVEVKPSSLPSVPFALQLSMATAGLMVVAMTFARIASGFPMWMPGLAWMAAAFLLMGAQLETSSEALKQQLGAVAAQGVSAYTEFVGSDSGLEGLLLAANLDRMGDSSPHFTALRAAAEAGPGWITAGSASSRPSSLVKVDDTWAWRGLGAAFGVMALFLSFQISGRTRKISEAFLEHWYAYAYIAPAVIGTAVLVFGPFLFGIVLGFYTRVYSTYEFVGLQNFIDILSDFQITRTKNFYRTLAVTVMWTVINVSLHVSIGLGLAMILKDKRLRFTPIYRTLLVIPWALPNYITALIWKGMFNKEYGAINAFLALMGVEPVSWFNTFWGAFFANLVTNVWLGFPFMMVISLGALQSIPGDLYEAADVDGANRWQKFRAITLPLLKPALFPAIILGVIWTFNQFNVIYLVSGGAPNGETDILITEAYRWAFEGRQQYGYAASYSTIIFLILFSYTYVTNKITKSTEGAYA